MADTQSELEAYIKESARELDALSESTSQAKTEMVRTRDHIAEVRASLKRAQSSLEQRVGDAGFCRYENLDRR